MKIARTEDRRFLAVEFAQARKQNRANGDVDADAKRVRAADDLEQAALRELFDERHIKPKNKLGQNFLIDLNLVDLIVRTGELTKEDLAIEIGCGTGLLLLRLAAECEVYTATDFSPIALG